MELGRVKMKLLKVEQWKMEQWKMEQTCRTGFSNDQEQYKPVICNSQWILTSGFLFKPY